MTTKEPPKLSSSLEPKSLLLGFLDEQPVYLPAGERIELFTINQIYSSLDVTEAEAPGLQQKLYRRAADSERFRPVAISGRQKLFTRQVAAEIVAAAKVDARKTQDSETD